MENKESQVLGISVRGWLAVLLAITVCIMSGLGIKVDEPLYTAFSLALGFYFGQKSK